MKLLKHEFRQGKNYLIIWTAIIAFMLSICVFIYPEIKGQMSNVSAMFTDMGNFSAAFGIDKINFGEFIGYFGIECGNVLGLGGAFFAALIGISMLSKEEKEKTSEFLLTHPINRYEIVMQKLFALFIQIVILNVVVIGITVFSIISVGEKPDEKILSLLFLAYFIMQIQIAAICFGISAFIGKGGLSIGLGIAALFYFINIVANLTENVNFLKYITPFSYTEAANIIANSSIDIKYLFVGLCLTFISIVAAFYKYGKKDVI